MPVTEKRLTGASQKPATGSRRAVFELGSANRHPQAINSLPLQVVSVTYDADHIIFVPQTDCAATWTGLQEGFRSPTCAQLCREGKCERPDTIADDVKEINAILELRRHGASRRCEESAWSREKPLGIVCCSRCLRGSARNRSPYDATNCVRKPRPPWAALRDRRHSSYSKRNCKSIATRCAAQADCVARTASRTC